jgi:hypothetical protein
VLLSQTPDYKTIFGKDWDKASDFEIENRSWMRQVLFKNHIDYYEALSIVFPELIRYSALKDKMEIGVLKTLYVNLGEEYADFSVGVFQMKPSFAEYIRENAKKIPGFNIRFRQKSDFDDVKDYRRSIIRDLEDPESEIIYLVTFIKMCRAKFSIDDLRGSEAVSFLATAYNHGIYKTKEEIESAVGKKFFSTRLIDPVYYSYSDISLYWYSRKVIVNRY